MKHKALTALAFGVSLAAITTSHALAQSGALHFISL